MGEVTDSGNFEHQPSCDATTLVKFRQLMGEEDVEVLLAKTINVAVDFKLIQQHLAQAIVDSTVQGNLIMGARALHGASYDGHTLKEQPEQDCRTRLSTTFANLGYRGTDAQNLQVYIVHRGKALRISNPKRKQLKRRQAIAPIVGHVKSENRIDRCHLKREGGDRLPAALCAAGYNIRWLLRMIASKDLPTWRKFFACNSRPHWGSLVWTL